MTLYTCPFCRAATPDPFGCDCPRLREHDGVRSFAAGLGCSCRMDTDGVYLVEACRFDQVTHHPSYLVVARGRNVEECETSAVEGGNVCHECGGPTFWSGAVVCGERRFCAQCADRHTEVCAGGAA